MPVCVGWLRLCIDVCYLIGVVYVVSYCHDVGSPRKSAAVIGFSHRSMSCSVIGFVGQLKRCAVSCGA